MRPEMRLQLEAGYIYADYVSSTMFTLAQAADHTIPISNPRCPNRPNEFVQQARSNHNTQ
jgi:hypothetical protein